MPRRVAPFLVLLALAAGCGDRSEPRAADPLDADVFSGQVEAIGGGIVDLSTFAAQDLVVWFWSPW